MWDFLFLVSGTVEVELVASSYFTDNSDSNNWSVLLFVHWCLMFDV